MSLSSLSSVLASSPTSQAVQTSAVTSGNSPANNADVNQAVDAADASTTSISVPVSLSPASRILLAQENAMFSPEVSTLPSAMQQQLSLTATQTTTSTYTDPTQGQLSFADVTQIQPMFLSVLSQLTQQSLINMGIVSQGDPSPDITFSSLSLTTTSSATASIDQETQESDTPSSDAPQAGASSGDAQQTGSQLTEVSQTIAQLEAANQNTVTGTGYILTADCRLYAFQVSVGADQSAQWSLIGNASGSGGEDVASGASMTSTTNMLPSNSGDANTADVAGGGSALSPALSQSVGVAAQNSNVAEQTPLPSKFAAATSPVGVSGLSGGTDAAGVANDGTAIGLPAASFGSINLDAILKQAKSILSLLASLPDVEQSQVLDSRGVDVRGFFPALQNTDVLVTTGPSFDSLNVYSNTSTSIAESFSQQLAQDGAGGQSVTIEMDSSTQHDAVYSSINPS